MKKFWDACGTWLVILAGVMSSFVYLAHAQPVSARTAATQTAAPVNVGYLLYDNFGNSTTGYSGSSRHMVSGWQITSNGGSLSTLTDPVSGIQNANLALTQSSSTDPITLQRRFSARTGGTLTWDSRFYFLNQMDGVTFQLQSGSTPVIQLLTCGGQLCYQNSNGSNVAMEPYTTNHEYGIRVVANLSSQQATIYIDGVLQASNVSFRNPSSSVDTLTIQTAPGANGTLDLLTERIYVGYQAFENFVTTAVGNTPADWTLNTNGGATGSVQAINSAQRPDIYSYQINDPTSGASARFSKNFAAQSGTLQFDYEMLLPSGMNGAQAQLLNGSTPALTLLTSGGNLDYLALMGGMPAFVP